MIERLLSPRPVSLPTCVPLTFVANARDMLQLTLGAPQLLRLSGQANRPTQTLILLFYLSYTTSFRRMDTKHRLSLILLWQDNTSSIDGATSQKVFSTRFSASLQFYNNPYCKSDASGFQLPIATRSKAVANQNLPTPPKGAPRPCSVPRSR